MVYSVYIRNFETVCSSVQTYFAGLFTREALVEHVKKGINYAFLLDGYRLDSMTGNFAVTWCDEDYSGFTYELTTEPESGAEFLDSYESDDNGSVWKLSNTLSDEQFLNILKTLRGRIAAGTDFTCEHEKCTCSWGVCARLNDFIHDDSYFFNFGDHSTKHKKSPQVCPLCAAGEFMTGCYYRCLIFRNKQSGRPGRTQVLDLYDGAIARFERWIKDGKTQP